MKPFIPHENMILLKRWANSISAYLHCPVYLVGSSLNKKDYRDVDVIAVITDWHFTLRFNGTWKEWQDEGITGEYTEIRWCWARECSKQWHSGAGETGLNLDFKILAAGVVENDSRPVFRLDSNPYTRID